MGTFANEQAYELCANIADNSQKTGQTAILLAFR